MGDSDDKDQEREDAAGAAAAATAGADERAHPLTIVGIGASAGGLEALEELLARLTSDGMAFVVVQHLAAEHESLLAEILARSTPLPVRTITDHTSVEPNVVLVAPPQADVAIETTPGERPVLRLRPRAEGPTQRTIDAFFRSLADALAPHAIGVVLSGAARDGTAGLLAIKEAGGITFVQDPTTAAQPGMPRSALDAGAADFALAPREIGDELVRLAHHPFVARAEPARVFDESALTEIFDRLRRAHGVDFGGYKRRTIERRIERRMALQKLDSVRDYLRLLRSSDQETATLYADLLIGVTSFFRDREPFELLASTIFPRILEGRDPARPIRIWVPGCASGEEAYSIAICLLEHLGDRARLHDIEIFATDIDDRALNVARVGIYPAGIEQDLSPERIQRFFSRTEKGYRVARHVRDLVVFARHDLTRDPPFSRLDLVSCRNVLIYMQPPLQRRVLRVLHYALAPDGFLMLGTSETVGDAADLFSLLDRRLKVYRKKHSISPAVAEFSTASRAQAREIVAPPPAADHRPVMSVQQLADRKVIERFGPPAVLLNETLEVIQFRGQTAPYLAPAPGTATFNVFKLTRPELLVELRAAIQAALTSGLTVESSPVALRDGSSAPVTIDVMPVRDAAARRKCLLVSFRRGDGNDDGLAGAAERGEKPARASGDDERSARELERELLVTKEYLQTTVHELEGANEDLQSSNEELQSTNEELQSTNEELETSKEELQSTNEELATVNEELQTRIAQLAVANDDLQNVLSMSSTAIVIVGQDLRIRRFSAEAARLLDLIAADVGRPIGYLSNVAKTAQIDEVVVQSIEANAPREQRVRCSDGLWYTLRVSPYRTGDHQAIRGAVVELVRAPPLRRGGTPAEMHELVGKVLSTLPHALVLLDDQLRVAWVNKRFFDTFEVGAEILGLPLDEVWPSRDEQPALWGLLDAATATGAGFEGELVAEPFGKPGRPMRFSARPIAGEGERRPLTLLVMEEVARDG